MKLLELTKPGIIVGNLITACGGFFLASQGYIDIFVLLPMLAGIALIIASGCVTNNYYDRDIDKLMRRTQSRPTAKGEVSFALAASFAAALGIAGSLILYFFVNTLTLVIALVGLFFYVVVYTMWLKRNSIYGTLIGGISGAVPPVVGYVALTNQIDMGAVVLFLILFTWQIPHSYAIAICRLEDYAAANIPVLPVKKGIPSTKASMLLYTGAFTLAIMMPSVLGITGWVYGVAAAGIGAYWLYLAMCGLRVTDNKAWARKMFMFSVLNITVLSAMMLVKI